MYFQKATYAKYWVKSRFKKNNSERGISCLLQCFKHSWRKKVLFITYNCHQNKGDSKSNLLKSLPEANWLKKNADVFAVKSLSAQQAQLRLVLNIKSSVATTFNSWRVLGTGEWRARRHVCLHPVGNPS